MIVDLPFLTYRDPETALRSAGQLVRKAGADAVKLEGGEHLQEVVHRLVTEGIPVVGHLGLTPQHVRVLGGFKVQGRDAEAIRGLLRDASALVAAGVTALVLEGVPDRVATAVTERISKPTIGIGAGSGTDGQVLVFHDCLGLSARTPKFVAPFAQGRALLSDGIARYRDAVRDGTFPDPAHSYHIDPAVVREALDPATKG
jgi:3-methyl-2-oxobutanoate hydroxymethyltransferase